jgi:hypothetical protein
MFRKAFLGVAILAAMTAAGLTACGSPASSSRAESSAKSSGSAPAPAAAPSVAVKSSAASALTMADSVPAASDAVCTSIPVLAGWSGIYQGCAFPGDTEIQVTNTAEWDVLTFQVAPDAYVPAMEVSPPNTDPAEMDSVEMDEFPHPVGSNYALVPPGSTLTAWLTNGAPVQLMVSVDFTDTAENVTALGLVNVIAEKTNPLVSDAGAIATCASYVNQLPAQIKQINQSDPSSPSFWEYFANAPDCVSAFNTVKEALGGATEETVLDDAASVTDDFFDDILPKLTALAAEDILG